MMHSRLAQFADQQYLNLETYRKDGRAVRTPVWSAEDEGVLYLRTVKNAGKVKRIRHCAQVRVALCDMIGTVQGEWVDGAAQVLNADGARRVAELLDRKYGAAKAEFERRNNLQNIAWDAIAVRVSFLSENPGGSGSERSHPVGHAANLPGAAHGARSGTFRTETSVEW